MRVHGITFPMHFLRVAVILSLIGLAWPAWADVIDARVDELRNSENYKVRLSAAVWLAGKPDERSIVALTRALSEDPEYTVRQVAAKSLGSLVDDKTPTKIRERALTALNEAAKNDAHKSVRRRATKSLKLLASLAQPVTTGSSKKVFVNIDKPSLGSHKAPRGLDKELQDALRGIVRRRAPDYETQWPGRLPTKAQLAANNTRGYYVGAKVEELDVTKNGGSVDVKCTVALQVNTWEGSDRKQRWRAGETAWAKGSGRVTSSNSPSGIDSAKRDCLVQVAEQITEKRVIPYLQQLVMAVP